MTAVETAKEQGGEVLVGGESVDRDGFFVKPTLIKADVSMPITKHETFAPILYIFEYEDLNDAIAANNDVPQGLSSAIFSDSFRSVERFLSPAGSDCGIANVNIGTSGAEIGGAFGGEKETGGGRGWIRFLEGVHASSNLYTQLVYGLAIGTRCDLRYLILIRETE